MKKRKITRGAKLQDYTGSPENLFPLIEEVAAKGYGSVTFQAGDGSAETLASLCEKAESFGLSVCLAAPYMKYQARYLSEHPGQKLVSASDFKDQDGLSTSSWGCPYNPEFKKAHIEFLKKAALFPGVERIQVNDEAYIPGGACYCAVCRGEYREEFGREMPVSVKPSAELWENPEWRSFIKWNIDRWNAVHGELAEAIHGANSEIKVIFQASPHNDLHGNPWSHSVDLAGMAERLDGICTDPYYTFHPAVSFAPRETYLSEWCRFLRGIVPGGKLVEIIPQGFSHPTFTRPLGEEDGRWSAVIPAACGVDIITPYTYTLQKASPVQGAYEDSFRLDEYFEKARPLDYAGLAHGVRTEIYRRPFPDRVPGSYDGTRVLPVAEALRHGGVPYGYIPDSRLGDGGSLRGYEVVILPEINCLGSAEEGALRNFVSDGGRLVVLGSLGTHDETGSPGRGASLLEDISGIKVSGEREGWGSFEITEELPFMDRLFAVDERIIREYSRGVYRPRPVLGGVVEAEVSGGCRVIGEFTGDGGGPAGRPAAVVGGERGNVLWLAGFPSRVYNNEYGLRAMNQAHFLLPLLVEWHAGRPPRLRVDNWPPETPMRKLWPLAPWAGVSMEFFPMEGDDMYLGVVASYFKEPARFPMRAALPRGKVLEQARELISGEEVECVVSGSEAEIGVELGFDDALKVFCFSLGKKG